MTRFLALTIFLVITVGLAIHAEVKFPWFLEWFGQLPGDMIIKKGPFTLYFPVTSSAIVSAALSIFLSLFSKK